MKVDRAYALDYARRRWLAGDTVQQIAADLETGRSTISGWAAREGWPRRRLGRRPKHPYAVIRQRLQAGEPWRRVLADYGADYWLVANHFSRMGWGGLTKQHPAAAA